MNITAIVGWDGSASASLAADWLAERQAREGRAMAIVRVVPDGTSSMRATAVPPDTASVAEEAEMEATRLRRVHPDLDVTVRILTGSPLDVLQQLSLRSNLVAVGRGALPAAPPGHLPAFAERLASTADGPVVVIPATSLESARGVVVGIDGSEASLCALDFAAHEASHLGEQLRVVHTWLSPAHATHDRRADLATMRLLEHRHEALLAESLRGVLIRHPTLDVQRRVVQGLPAKTLLHETSTSRMLVVGNHARRQIARFLLGSVTDAVLRGAERPTIVVKPADGNANAR